MPGFSIHHILRHPARNERNTRMTSPQRDARVLMSPSGRQAQRCPRASAAVEWYLCLCVRVRVRRLSLTRGTVHVAAAADTACVHITPVAPTRPPPLQIVHVATPIISSYQSRQCRVHPSLADQTGKSPWQRRRSQSIIGEAQGLVQSSRRSFLSG